MRTYEKSKLVRSLEGLNLHGKWRDVSSKCKSLYVHQQFSLKISLIRSETGIVTRQHCLEANKTVTHELESWNHLLLHENQHRKRVLLDSSHL